MPFSMGASVGHLWGGASSPGHAAREALVSSCREGRDRDAHGPHQHSHHTLAVVQMAIIKIGAFINVGAKTDGLLHISQISTEYVSSVTDRLQVGQEVEVRVLTIEPDGLKFACGSRQRGGHGRLVCTAVCNAGMCLLRRRPGLSVWMR